MTRQNGMELGDYIDILNRRKVPFFTAFVVIFILGLVIAFTLPPIYRSEATILIERQEIPEDLVATTVTGYVQERIEGIRQRLVTYENLVEIAESLDLHPDLRKSGELSSMVKLIRENILVSMVDIRAGSSRAAATVAFTVGFEAEKAKTAQKVAAELAKRFLDENKQARGEQAVEVSQFFEKEAERLRLEIVTLEKALAKFKQEQSEQLPELLQVNMRLYEKTEGQIESTKDRIQKISDQITFLQSELSLTDPRKAVRSDDGKIIQSPSERLNALISKYLQYSIKYSPDHPDMIRLRREIQALGSQSDAAGKISKLVSQLYLLKSKLLDAKQKYSVDHPDVLQLDKSILSVESEIRNINLSDSHDSSFSDIPADNPRYVSLKTQMDAAVSNLKSEEAKLISHQDKLKEYERRLFQTPIVERDYQALTRDYGNAKKKYSELKNKQLEARLAEQLESGEKGERFVLEGRAYLPTSPDKPNRLGIALLAIFLAIGGGVVFLIITEARDMSIRGIKGVVEVYGSRPMIIIPYIKNTSDINKQKNKRLKWIGVGFVMLSIVTYGAYYAGIL